MVNARSTRDWSFAWGFGATMISVAAFAMVVSGRSESPLQAASISPGIVASYDSMGLGRMRGASTARDTLLEVTDFLCPACARAHSNLELIIDSLVQRGALVHRVLEVPFQLGSVTVSVAAACAWSADPAGYWRYRKVLFDAQRAVAAAYPVEHELVRLAPYARVDSVLFKECIIRDSTELSGRFVEALRLARLSPIGYTPVYSINGTVVSANTLAERLRNGM